MKKPRLLLFVVCLGSLMLGLSLGPTLAKAADAQPIVGDWEGTLDPGAQPKKRIVVHISAAQDGTLSGTIDYPDQRFGGADHWHNLQRTRLPLRKHFRSGFVRRHDEQREF